jgi:hypothetical protein
MVTTVEAFRLKPEATKTLASIICSRTSLRASMRALAFCAIVLLASIGSAAGQPPGPYVTGHIGATGGDGGGATGGDGGGALITGVAAGYMARRRLAFE